MLNHSFEQRSAKRSMKKKKTFFFTEEQNCLLPYTAPKRLLEKLQMSASLRYVTKLRHSEKQAPHFYCGKLFWHLQQYGPVPIK